MKDIDPREMSYHAHKASLAKHITWKEWWLFHGPLLLIPVIMYLYCYIKG